MADSMTDKGPPSRRQDKTYLLLVNFAEEKTAVNEFQSHREYVSFLAEQNPIFEWLSQCFEHHS